MNVFLTHKILEVHLYCLSRVKSPKAETKTTCRRSMRLQRIDPLGIPLPEPEAKVESPVEEEHVRGPQGRGQVKIGLCLALWVTQTH